MLMKRAHYILLFFTSFCVLAYEILLMRLLSVMWWQHFAYMVISLALLGFGAAGSLLFLFFERMKSKLDSWLLLLGLLTALAFSLSFGLSQKTGLDPLQLIWRGREWLIMLLTYLVMGIPFLFAGGIVGILLSTAGEEAHRMYATDLLGAGCGALAVVPALYLGAPWNLLPAVGGLVLVGISGLCLHTYGFMKGSGLLLTAACLIVAGYRVLPAEPRIHHTKGLEVALCLPDARIEAERVGPQGIVQVVGSSAIREVPGLSLAFSLDDRSKDSRIPPQKEIFLDAESLGPMTRFTGDRRELLHLDYTTMALPYHVRHIRSALILGSGGGRDVLMALGQGVSKITAVEANQQVADLIQGPFAYFTGQLYSKPEVDLKIREARQFIHSTPGTFDLIQLSLLGSFGSSTGGLASAEEDYLLTVEAFRLYLSKLSDSGMLSVTRWLKVPPRDSLRVVATALEALREAGTLSAREGHILFIRSWKTSTILISKGPITAEDIASATRFCDIRSFDLAYYAGMKKERANRYDILKEPYYFLGASALCSEKARTFLDDYVFDLAPTTDDRPYFSHFLQLEKVGVLFRNLGREWLPLIETGYVFIVATLIQAVVASGIFILLPLVFLRCFGQTLERGAEKRSQTKVLGTILYFGSVGLAFMLIEMALLPKFTFLLAHPVYSTVLVLSSILVFAGFGSLCVGKFQARWGRFLWIGLFGILLWVGLMFVGGERLFGEAILWPLYARLAVTVGLSGFLAFFLGWPFPAGLRVMARTSPALVPWAWGVNGCASVVGAVLGKLLSISFGFHWTTILACALYVIAAVTFYGLLDSPRPETLKMSLPRAHFSAI
jgi:hypothetical protein